MNIRCNTASMSTVKNIAKVPCNLWSGHTVKEIRRSNDNIEWLQTRILSHFGTSLCKFLNLLNLHSLDATATTP